MKKKSTKSKNSKQLDFDNDPLATDLDSFITEDGWVMAQFELKEKKDQTLSLRISKRMLDELKKQARSVGIDTQKFIRILLENSIRRRLN